MSSDSEMLGDAFQPPAVFIGRESQLEWMRRIYFSHYRWNLPFVVTGPAGSGKSTIVSQFLTTYRISAQLVWLRVRSSADETLRVLSDQLQEGGQEEQRYSGYAVVFDDADVLPDEQISHLFYGAVNWKAVRSVFFTSRRPLPFEAAPTLTLTGFTAAETRDFLERTLPYKLSEEQLQQAALVIQGNPLAAGVLLQILQTVGPEGLDQLLAGRVYDLAQAVSEPEVPKLIIPKIVSVSELLIENLKKHPESIYDLSPRKFEEILAELLTDMGVEVQLTQQTRDDGRDILAYVQTELGKLLCLVEAKRNRQDRKVGVGLVRTLYGTLCDAHANSAMLVTTSSFSQDAQAFAAKYEWRLHLRDYGNLVSWIQGYKTGPRSPFKK